MKTLLEKLEERWKGKDSKKTIIVKNTHGITQLPNGFSGINWESSATIEKVIDFGVETGE